MSFRFAIPVFLFALSSLFAAATEGAAIPIADPTFSGSAGVLAGVVDLNVFNAAPSSITTQLGSSPWSTTAEASPLLNLGFRAGVDVNSSVAGAGSIRYDLGVSLGGLLGVELPETTLWQPLTGYTLQPNTHYHLTADVDSTSGLSLSVLSDMGIGIGLTTGASSLSMGSFAVESLSSPGLITLVSLGGSTQRMVLDFTTTATPAAGTLGVALFAGRGFQTLTAGSPNVTFDNVSLTATAVPEPSAAFLAAFGLAVLTTGRVRRRSVL